MHSKSFLVLVASALILGICLTGIESHAQGIIITGDNSFGCSDKEYFDKMVGYATDGDNGVFARAFAACVLAGVCTEFKNGEEVVPIADGGMTSGGLKVQKVRRKGDVTEYWTLSTLMQ